MGGCAEVGLSACSKGRARGCEWDWKGKGKTSHRYDTFYWIELISIFCKEKEMVSLGALQCYDL